MLLAVLVEVLKFGKLNGEFSREVLKFIEMSGGFSREVLKFVTLGNQKIRCFGHGRRITFLLGCVFEGGLQQACKLQLTS